MLKNNRLLAGLYGVKRKKLMGNTALGNKLIIWIPIFPDFIPERCLTLAAG
jgi:hypothetical protein